MSFVDPFATRFEVFGREHKHTVEGINRPAFEKLSNLLDVRAGGDGRVVLLRAPRAGYGKTSILQRLAADFAESHHFVRVSLVSGRTTDAVHVLEYVLQALCQVLPDSTTLTRLDLLARRILALGLEPLVASGEVPCQDREGALLALREEPAETFDFHHDRAVTAHWTKSNFEILGPRMAAELASRSGASLREASYWVELLFRFATTAPDNVERARLLFETVFRGDLQSQSESAAEERLHGLLALCGTVTNLVLIVDDTEGLSTAPGDALALASFLTNISQCCPGTLVLLSLNDDIWESAFLPLLPGGLADRLMENEVALSGLTREEAEALIAMRAGKRTPEVIEKIDWDGACGKLYSRQVLKWASDVWQTLEHRDESGFDVLADAEGLPEGDRTSTGGMEQAQVDDPFEDPIVLGSEFTREEAVPGRGMVSEVEEAGPLGGSPGAVVRGLDLDRERAPVTAQSDDIPRIQEGVNSGSGPSAGDRPGDHNPFSEVGGSLNLAEEPSVPGTPASIFGRPDPVEKIPAEPPSLEETNPFRVAGPPPSSSDEPAAWVSPATSHKPSDAESVWSAASPERESGEAGAQPVGPMIPRDEPGPFGSNGDREAGTNTKSPMESPHSNVEPVIEPEPGNMPRSADSVGSPFEPGQNQSGEETGRGRQSFSPFSVVSGSAGNPRTAQDEAGTSQTGNSPDQPGDGHMPNAPGEQRGSHPGQGSENPVNPVQVRNPFQPDSSSTANEGRGAGSSQWRKGGEPLEESEPGEQKPVAGYSPFKPVALEPTDPSSSPFVAVEGIPPVDGTAPSPSKHGGERPEAVAEASSRQEKEGKVDQLLRQFKERYGRKE